MVKRHYIRTKNLKNLVYMKMIKRNEYINLHFFESVINECTEGEK